MPITRLAPSPTGALHLGNARTFLVNWLLARRNGWRIILRIEDLDGPRIKQGADRQAIEDLRWLGIDWDEGPVYQSRRTQNYETIVNSFLKEGLAYACVCSRKEIEGAASAPHAEDGSNIYPGICRGRYGSLAEAQSATEKPAAVRFMVHPGVCEFDDVFAGHQRFDLMAQIGDFIIAKNDGTAAYQLAVVVDDLDMGITHIVRGDDLIDSAPRQMLIYQALGQSEKIPQYYHLPLVVGADGRRLAKRHGDTRLSHYRDEGISASRILGLLARWCGIPVTPDVKSANDLLHAFALDRVPKERIIFSEQDDKWLRQSS